MVPLPATSSREGKCRSHPYIYNHFFFFLSKHGWITRSLQNHASQINIERISSVFSKISSCSIENIVSQCVKCLNLVPLTGHLLLELSNCFNVVTLIIPHVSLWCNNTLVTQHLLPFCITLFRLV